MSWQTVEIPFRGTLVVKVPDEESTEGNRPQYTTAGLTLHSVRRFRAHGHRTVNGERSDPGPVNVRYEFDLNEVSDITRRRIAATREGAV